MPYEVVYDKDSGKIMMARSSAAPRDDLILHEEQAKLFLAFDLGGRPMSAFRVDADAGTLVLRDDWVEPEAGVRLALSVDATATSPIEEIPEVPADGQSEATITVQKISTKSGQALTGHKHDNRLFIRTTAGTLSHRQIHLEQGQARFTLRSSTETVVAEVRVWAQEIPGDVTTRVEFAPLP